VSQRRYTHKLQETNAFTFGSVVTPSRFRFAELSRCGCLERNLSEPTDKHLSSYEETFISITNYKGQTMKALLFIGIAIAIDMIVFTLIIPYIIKMVVQRYRKAHKQTNLDNIFVEVQDDWCGIC
jgi:mannose/fructose/N-acetylgalactosamine-specific phosphotransferase system component IIC